MTDEEDAEEIINLSFIPVGAIVKTAYRRYRLCFICISLDANARVVSDREKVINDLESLVSCWKVYGCDIGNLCELGGCVISASLTSAGSTLSICRMLAYVRRCDLLQEGEDWNDARWRNINGELVLPDTILLNIFGEAREDISSIFVHCLGLFCILVCRIDNLAIENSIRYVLISIYI